MKKSSSGGARSTLLLTIAIGIVGTAVAAEKPDGGPEGFVFGLNEENDSFAFPEADKHYTQGFQMSLLWPDESVPGPLRPLTTLPDLDPPDFTQKFGIAVGQKIYTPKTNSPEIITNDRPYAGWLYLGAIRQARGSSLDGVPTLDRFEVDLGVVGPAALAGNAQNAWHHVDGDGAWLGWSHQLPNEPGFLLSDDRQWLAWQRGATGPYQLQLIPKAALSLGNIETAAKVGVKVRLGRHLPDDFFPAVRRRTGWYAFGELDGRAVLYDEFLDGDLFRKSPNIAKAPLGGEWRTGGALVFKHTELRYTYQQLTHEFKQQDKCDAYGSIELIRHF